MPSPEAIVSALKKCRIVITTGGPGPNELRDLAAAWAELLHDVTDAELHDAVTAHLRSPTPWWPTPGQLLALVPSRRMEALDDADTAWGEALRLVSAWGGRRLEDPATWERARPSDERRAAAMLEGVKALGGWVVLGMSTADEHTAMRASFRTAYRAVGTRRAIADDVAASRRLTGPAALESLLTAEPRGGGFRALGGPAPAAPTPAAPIAPPRPAQGPSRPPPPAPAPALRVAVSMEERRRQVEAEAQRRGLTPDPVGVDAPAARRGGARG